MIGLDREDAGGGLDIGLGEQRRSALVGGDADVLEQIGAEQEILLAAILVEGLARGDQLGGHCGGGEGAVGADRQVERRLLPNAVRR
jgi:hypothetical protein